MKLTGFYDNGKRRVIDQWLPDGSQYVRNVTLDSTTLIYKDSRNNILEGRKILSGREVYFTNGKVDSLIADAAKFMHTHDNFIDGIRTLFFYDELFRTLGSRTRIYFK